MKRLILLYLLTFVMCFAKANIPEYKSFMQAKNHYLNKDYEKAKLEFENFYSNYKNTKLFNSNYANFYIGMNYYKLNDLKNALKFLDSSIYKPYYLSQEDSLHNNFFQFQRAFYLGSIYSDLGLKTNAKYQYASLIKDYYHPDLEDYEKHALTTLASNDPYYNYILQAKYNHDFSSISKLKNSDLKTVAHYLYSKGEFLDFYKNYSKYNSPTNFTTDLMVSTLNILEELDEYNLIIELLKNQEATNNFNNSYYYYWGDALRRLNKPLEAIEKYKLVKNNSYLEKANYSIARTYFTLKDYNNAIRYVKNLKGDKAHELLTRSYFNSEKIEEFKDSAIKYIQNYPNSDLAGYYRNLLYNESKNPNYLNWIIKHNLNSYYYQVAYNITKSTRELEEYPINFEKSKHLDLVDTLEAVSNLSDPELIVIELDSLNLPNDKLFEHYIRSIYLEKVGLYGLAMKNSLEAEDDFSKFSNLHSLLYPKYYKSLVGKYSKKYDVEEALVYSIIKESSKFNSNLISKGTHFGLMQLDLKTAKIYSNNITSRDLLDPETNINIGVKHLSSILNENDNNISRTIASFNSGYEVSHLWSLDKNGDIDVEQIPYFNSQEFIKKSISNYYKYKNIYKN